jgi:hypothetical protein
VQAFQALVLARTGETDKAISEVERLLTTRFAMDYGDESITLSELRPRWEWDPLRNDPRFQKILAGPEPKTTHNRSATENGFQLQVGIEVIGGEPVAIEER